MYRIRTFVLAIFALSVIISNSTPKVSASPSELSYDDGRFDYTWSDFYPVAATVKFSPPSQTWSIVEVIFYGVCILPKNPVGEFRIQICDDRLNPIYQASYTFSSYFADKNATFEWFSIKMPGVTVKGDFYVLIVPCLTLDGPKLWIGVDDDEPIYNMSFTVDATKHEVIRCWDATSEMPRNFMVRVRGEPTEAPPELKIISIEFSENDTLVKFSVLRATLRWAEAKLFKELYGAEECKVYLLDNSSFLVSVKSQGSLNVCAETDRGYVSTGVEIGGNLRGSYHELLTRYWLLGNESAKRSVELERLVQKVTYLSQALNESEALAWVLNRRISDLAQNLTSLEAENKSLKEVVVRLSVERTWLSLGFAVAAIATISLAALEVRRRWRR